MQRLDGELEPDFWREEKYEDARRVEVIGGVPTLQNPRPAVMGYRVKTVGMLYFAVEPQ